MLHCSHRVNRAGQPIDWIQQNRCGRRRQVCWCPRNSHCHDGDGSAIICRLQCACVRTCQTQYSMHRAAMAWHWRPHCICIAACMLYCALHKHRGSYQPSSQLLAACLQASWCVGRCLALCFFSMPRAQGCCLMYCVELLDETVPGLCQGHMAWLNGCDMPCMAIWM